MSVCLNFALHRILVGVFAPTPDSQLLSSSQGVLKHGNWITVITYTIRGSRKSIAQRGFEDPISQQALTIRNETPVGAR